MSTSRPFSCAISSVRSIGKPNVSCSLNATSPDTPELLPGAAASVICTNSFSPAASVVRNDASSATQTARIRSALAASSGYWAFMAAMLTSASSPKTG